MKATKTKKMMITATLLTMTACAGVDESNGSGTTGDDTGSDMQPETTGSVTIDSTDFVVDGSMWWSSSAAPRIHGTFAGPAGLTIEVKAGNAPAVTATLTGNEWSVQLAADSITTSNTMITVTLREPSGAKIELVQAIGLDGAPPAIVLLPSKVRDERADQISFASGDPVHTHAGAEIDLAAGACPSVYKYAYLMSAAAPLYGSQTAPNDLAWHLKILDAKLDASSEQYRIRGSAGDTLVNWTALPAANDVGVATIKLTTTNVPQLATTSGQFFIDVRANDLSMLETTATFCFDHHPLAAPLDIAPIEIATNAAPSWSFAANSPISELTGFEFGGSFVEQRIVQHTAEPIFIELGGRADSVHYTKTYASGYVKFGERRIYESEALPITPGPRNSTSGVALSYGQMAVLVDTATNGIPHRGTRREARDSCTRCEPTAARVPRRVPHQPAC